MQLLKAKTGKIIHAQQAGGERGRLEGACACGKRNLVETDQGTANQIVEKGGAYCPSALALMEPHSGTSDEGRWVSEPKTLADLSPADIQAINDSATDQLHAYQRIAGTQATKRVRGQRIHVKPRKKRRQRTRNAKRGASWGVSHARVSGRPKVLASLYTHRCFQDVPGGFMLRQPLGGGDMVPARAKDRAALKAAR